MFTGLIQQKGRIESLESAGRGHLVVRTDAWDRPIELGESIAVSGVCLTVTRTGDGLLSFDVLAETFRRTNLGQRIAGEYVNLERALRQGDPLGGHMVQGHVDAPGQVVAIESVDADHRVTFSCDSDLLHYIVYKGSIAIDGISLTVAERTDTRFSVHIIPHTWEVTTFSKLVVGDAVNLEADAMAKYVFNALAAGRSPVPIDWDTLKQSGYEALST